jgi:hypothetical protein
VKLDNDVLNASAGEAGRIVLIFAYIMGWAAWVPVTGIAIIPALPGMIMIGRVESVC